ncbi:protein FAM161B isoform X1 [Gallus gallus]|uniref:protein FAM161B isoform X1 n=1 Tax=Gallus gallus TaxID=9031 RepID=UPI001AE8FFA5|nr:protein FAM161B isoform X1 [Gallus gallus]XP_040528628.1 protein FAM161B isoform X1 [Gallus gallus]XP_040528629.1 protein FAM161B isoform X1 [Gallus gallus]
MESHRSLLELGLLCQAALGSDLSASQEDEDLGDLSREAAALRARLRAVLSHTSGNKRQSRSLIDLTSDSTWDQQKPHLFPKPRLRPKSASSPWIPSITIPQPFKMTLREARKKSQLMKSNMFLELDKLKDKRQSQDEAECQKQFRAQPVPAHVFLPLYHEIMEQNEVRRQIATQKRKELLLSTQRPFSFLEKEEKKKEAIRQKFLAAATPNESSKLKKVNRKVPRSTNDTLLGDKLKEAELYREIRIQMRAKDLLESSVAPIDTSNCRRDPQSRTATKTKQERLGFLQDRSFSFKPRINPTVPDFEELYWAFQREAVRRQEIKEATRIKPFKLRTSNLRGRQREANEKIKDSQQLSKVSVQKSHSWTALSSLSSNTLPVHITDATRKREAAIRYSQESKKEGDKEGIYWLEKQKKKCQAIRKSVNSRAKALDPHKSLDETHKEKLKQNRQNMRERTKEYRKELEEMQLRVKNRPYLFEQVSKVTGQSSKCLWVTGYIVFDLGQALRNHLKSFTVRKVLVLVESVDYTWDSHTDVKKIPFHDLKKTGTYLIIELSNP